MHPTPYGLFPDPSIGPYRLLERIGAGGCGEVFRARELFGLHREVCIKRISARFSTPEARAEVREEARLLATVRHANVIALEALGEDRFGAPFLVLELVRGSDLAKLRGAPWDPTIATHIACGILRALAAVQRASRGLVHRDVTPHNILVSDEGEVKLADFGIALTEGRARWTLPNCVKGKCGYMAPEQILGEPLDGRTDLYSVGILLYELLTGVRPCDPLRGMDELHATVWGRGLPLKIRAPRLPAPFANAVSPLFSRDSRDRYSDPEAALRALAPFSAGELGPLVLRTRVHTRSHSGSNSCVSSTPNSMETHAFPR